MPTTVDRENTAPRSRAVRRQLALFATAGWLFVLGTTAYLTKAASAHEPPARSTQARGRARTDAAVLEAVLRNLLDDPDSPLESSPTEPRRILVAPKDLRDVPDAEETLKQYEPERWRHLTHAQLKLARQAAEGLARRVRTGDGITGYQPKDRRTVLYTKEQEDRDRKGITGLRRLLHRPQVFRVSPPGYSRDGKMAVIHIWFPWSIHAGFGTYVLSKSSKGWVILVRQLVYLV